MRAPCPRLRSNGLVEPVLIRPWVKGNRRRFRLRKAYLLNPHQLTRMLSNHEINEPTAANEGATRREMGRDWRMRRGDGDRMGRDDRDVGPEMRRGDRNEYRDRDKDRGRYGDRDDRDNQGWDRAERDRDYRSYDDDRARRRVKVCVEYENGDEYCRYRQGR